jgi:hypothetical protein
VGRAWFWIVVLLAIVALPLSRAFFRRLPPSLPILGDVPAFSLVDQHGEPFGSKDLLGRAWLFAALSPSAPEGGLIGEKIHRIQHRAHHLGGAFHVVCVTTDPAHDPPPDLEAFVRKQHGSPRMWSFLTGDASDVSSLIVRLSSLPGLSRPGFVLVDPWLRARAVYDPLAADVVERVLFDVGLWVNRGG